MIRLSALFVAVCMVLIAGSLGLVLYLTFGVTGAESAVIALAALTGLAVYNATATRMRYQSELSGQIGDLSRGTADLARQVGEQGRRIAALEKNADASLQKAITLTQPYQNEISELGSMLRQVAQAVASQDTALRALGGHPVAMPALSQAAPNVAPNAMPDVSPKETSAAPPSPAADTSMPDSPEKPETVEAAPAPRLQLTDTIKDGAFRGQTGHAIVAAVREAITDNRIDVYLQPIVTLPQRKVRYYEALMRLRLADDKIVAAGEFLPYAELGGLVPGLDYLIVTRCVRILRRLQTKTRDVGVFCNLSAVTLSDREAMSQIIDFAEANRVLGPVLTFEIAHPALRLTGARENENLSRLTDLGFRLSVDHVTDLRFDTRDLADRKCAYMKIPASVLLDRSNQAAADIHPADIANLLARNGIELIAEKVESEATVVDLLDFDLRYGQGNLFSPPRPVKQEQIKPEEKSEERSEGNLEAEIEKEKEAAAAAAKAAAMVLPPATLPSSFGVPGSLGAAARAAAAEHLPSPDFNADEMPKAESAQPEVIHGASALARLAKIVARQKTGT